MNAKAPGFFIGIVFGFVLAWARVTDPSVIRRMLLLEEPHVFLIMAAAIVTAALGSRVLRRTGQRSIVTGEPIAWTNAPVEARHVTGSAVFGAGWSIACTCPGPIAAMIGEGRLTGVVVGAGLMAGIAIQGRLRRGARRSPLPARADQRA
jgi:uncharacterized membrane protein YedE/YeeE